MANKLTGFGDCRRDSRLSGWGARVSEVEAPGLGPCEWTGVDVGEVEARQKGARACEVDVPYMFEQNMTKCKYLDVQKMN